MKTRFVRPARILLACLLILPAYAGAQTTGTLSYQGRLTANGTNVHGPGSFRFALVSAPINVSRRATATATVVQGRIVSIQVTDPGSGYQVSPNVVIGDSTGSGASARASVVNGQVTQIFVSESGNGYSTRPAVRLAEPPPSYIYNSYWSNNGTSSAGGPPTLSVDLEVDDGLFMVQLGDTTVTGMTHALDAAVFTNPDVHLRVWYEDHAGTLTLLGPDHPVGTAGRALIADQVRDAGVSTLSLANRSVTANKIALGSVSVLHLSDGAVQTPKLANNSVTGSKLALNAVSTTRIADQAVTSAKIADGSIQAVDLDPAVLNQNAWRLNGNQGTTAGVNFLGTTDNEPLELRVQNQRGLRLEPAFQSPNLLGGISIVGNSTWGATIGGGGYGGAENQVHGNYGTIGGGNDNRIFDYGSVIGGGTENRIEAGSQRAVIAGGDENYVGGPNASLAVIGGGLLNTNRARWATLGGGNRNHINNAADGAVLSGGNRNHIGASSGNATIGGGENNVIHPFSSGATIPGGFENEVDGDYSLAAGFRAKAMHSGTFVWSDDSTSDFTSTDSDQFLIRARNGVGIGTANPQGHLHVEGNASGSNPHLFLREPNSSSSSYVRQRFKQGGGLFWELQVGGGSTNVMRFTNFRNGPVMTLNESGELFVNVLTILGGADLAEPFPMDEANIPKGAVVVIDETNPGNLRMSDRAYDTRVAGIVSGANGVQPGLTLRQEGVMTGNQNVALSGRVYALADASHAPIQPGDLLTTSDTPGHAMKAADPNRTHGTVIGKAMSSLEEGKGLVLVLVSLH